MWRGSSSVQQTLKIHALQWDWTICLDYINHYKFDTVLDIFERAYYMITGRKKWILTLTSYKVCISHVTPKLPFDLTAKLKVPHALLILVWRLCRTTQRSTQNNACVEGSSQLDWRPVFIFFPFKYFQPTSRKSTCSRYPTRLHGHQKLPRVPYQFWLKINTSLSGVTHVTHLVCWNRENLTWHENEFNMSPKSGRTTLILQSRPAIIFLYQRGHS